MIAARRVPFNAGFRDDRYQEFLQELEARCGVPVGFRVSETPCFFAAALIERLAAEAETMIDQLIGDAGYRRAADDVVPPQFRVAHSEPLPTFVQVDFGLVQTDTGVEGRLVELQAFPSLYGFQMLLAETSCAMWDLRDVSVFPRGLTRDEYLGLLRQAIAGTHDPAEVVLMEIDPEHQKTRPDFAMTERLWGVRPVDVREVRRDGRRLFYRRNGVPTPIKRVYNRLIPEDVERLKIDLPFDYRDDLDVEWAGGPDWYFRISKFSIPYLRHPWVPRTVFLSAAESGDMAAEWRADRDRWLLKPLFSYAGGGIVFSPTDAQIAAIPEPARRQYVLQERVAFTPVIATPHGMTQAELRMMFVHHDGRFRLMLPLVRMGRGRMMGVDHNKGLSWVGASSALMVP